MSSTNGVFSDSVKRQGDLLLDAFNFRVGKRKGEDVAFDRLKIEQAIRRCCAECLQDVSVDLIVEELMRNIYDGIPTKDLERALILAAVALMERDPAYDVLAARLFLQRIYKEIIGISVTEHTIAQLYQDQFIIGIKKGIEAGRLNPRLADFPLEELAKKMVIERDNLFRYMGIATLYERYFLKAEKTVLELPQAFWMRVAMGLALNEKDQLNKTVEFYNVLSTLRYVSSTPTLFHAAMVHAQLSSCYLTYVDDDLNHIFKCLRDNANLSKFSGGIGNDWTQLRAAGTPIKSINADSQGLIPFLRIANDVVSAINRSGNRRGATCAYLEVWHLDYEDFLDLRRNTGDERRRTHDMNTASWIPDLFMKRVLSDGDWTFFSPHETPDLHGLYGKKFEERYAHYELMALQGKIEFFKVVKAQQLWRKMLTRLFETGHPWVTFKDACNVRSPQDHAGVVHSSNLCTEITLNTSREETAVCNIGSVNLGRHVFDGKIDDELLAQTIETSIRMLDNVIDINFYPTSEAKASNMRHRPIGIGVMGFQDALFKMDLSFEDERTLQLADELQEKVSYHSIKTSALLAQERGAYESFKGSKWDRNIFPVDTLDLLEQERGMPIDTPRTCSMDWAPVRALVQEHGMRNSNLMAIAPTATISNIVGCFPSIEPIYKNMYVKANLNGEFTVINHYLVHDLKKAGLWSKEMADKIKYFDGSVQMIEEIPTALKNKYKEAFEINQEWLVKLAARRAKWIDQSQSLNIFVVGASGKKLNDLYFAGWQTGVKTFYYLRTMAASQIEKSTLDAKTFGFTQKRQYDSNAGQSGAAHVNVPATDAAACNIDDLSCESCQ
ncbi:ribonucleoside-diphosphate reductase subunit alpha [Candidatus Babeliales bacterium]|nr:ribonucleoside-diphosphate reductase subunit alpha [Candidatus Babeliales bacterium]